MSFSDTRNCVTEDYAMAVSTIKTAFLSDSLTLALV